MTNLAPVVRRLADPILIVALSSALLLAACASTGESVRAEKASAPERQINPEALRLADAALEDGLHQDAMKQYTRILQVDKDNARARLGIAEVHLARGEVKKAKEQFDTLAEDASVRARAQQGRGLALLALGQRDAALKALREATAEDPQLWRSWNAQGRILDGERHWEEAAEAYERALAVVPESAAVHNNLGYSLMMQGRHADAEQHLTKALQLQPGLEQAQGNLRLVLAMQRKYLAALSGVPRDKLPEVLNNVGYMAMLAGDLDAAESYLTRAIEISPSYHDVAAKNLLRVKALAGKAETAETPR